MSKIENGGAGEIPPVEVECIMDEFENSVRKIGVVACCEWFGHSQESEFTREVIETLMQRSAENPAKGENT